MSAESPVGLCAAAKWPRPRRLGAARRSPPFAEEAVRATDEARLRRHPRGRRARSGRTARLRAARGRRRRHPARRPGRAAAAGWSPSPVAQRAEEAGIEVLKPARPRDEDFLARLREIAPDCCPVVAYGALLPRVALDVPAHGWVNLHFSLLPAWRGAAPVQHAVHRRRRGDRRVHLPDRGGAGLRPGLRRDHRGGPPHATPAAICSTRLALRGRRTAGRHHGRHRGRHAAGPSRSPPRASRSRRRSPSRTPASTGRAPALRVDRRGARLHPGPRRLDRLPRRAAQAGSRPTRVPAAARELAPGELAVGKNTRPRRHRFARRELGWVQPQGKKPMRAADWARGVRIASGERLGE